MVVNLQFLRLIAALMVVVCHIILFGNSKYGFGLPQLNQLSDLLTMGVDIFFVVSGFVMVHVTRDKHVPPREFLSRRVKRIYPVYWFLSLLLLPVFFLRPGWINAGAEAPTSLIKSFLLFPQAGAPLIMVAWTLEFEMFFYLMFALTLPLGLRKQVTGLTLGFCGLVLLGHFVDRSHSRPLELVTSPLLLEFVAGMWLGFLYTGWSVRRWHLWLLALLLAGSLCYVGLFRKGEIERLLHFGPTALLTVSLALGLEKSAISAPRGPSLVGGNISYSLYLVHVMVISAVGRTWMKFHPHMSPYWLVPLDLLGSFAAAVLLYYLLEKPVLEWGRRKRTSTAEGSVSAEGPVSS